MDLNRNYRLKMALKEANVSQEKLALRLGTTRSAVSDRLGGEKQIDSIEFITAVSELTGVDFYELKDGIRNAVVVSDQGEEYGIKRIPFYDVEATGGMNGGDVTAVTQPTGTIDIGDILRDSEAAIRMAGNSMMPGYPPGSVLGLIPRKGRKIIPGEVYVYEDEDGRHCKRLFYKDEDPTSDTYICYSDTTTKFESGPREGKLFYPPYELKVKDILRLFTVVGVIKRNANGAINYKPNK